MWLKIANVIFSDNWIVQNKQTVLVHIIKYPVIFFLVNKIMFGRQRWKLNRRLG